MKKSSLIFLLVISLLLRASEHKYPSFDFSNNPYNTAFKSNSRYTRIGSADVNLATGHFTMQKNLLTLPGRGDLNPSLTLSYLSALASYRGRATPETTYTGQSIQGSAVILDLPGAGGIGWNVLMGEMFIRWSETSEFAGWVRLGDGIKHQIAFSDDSYHLANRPDWKLEWCNIDSLVLTSPEGIRYIFDRLYWLGFYGSPWYTEEDFLTLTKVIDKFGNYIKIEYCVGETDTLWGEIPIIDTMIDVDKTHHIKKITSPTGDSAVFHYSDDSLYLENISYWDSDGEEVNIKFEYQLDTLEGAISIWRGDTVKLLSSVGYYDSSDQLLYPKEEFEYNDKGVLSEYHHPYGGIEEYSFEEVKACTAVIIGDTIDPESCILYISRCNRLTEINIRKNSEPSGNKYSFWYGNGEGEWDSRNSQDIISSVGWHSVRGDTLPTYGLPMYKAVKLEKPDSSYSVYSFTDKSGINGYNWCKLYLLGVFEERFDCNVLGDTLGRVKEFLRMDNHYLFDTTSSFSFYYASTSGRLVEKDGIKQFSAYMIENVYTGELMVDEVVQVKNANINWHTGIAVSTGKRGTVSRKIKVARPVYSPYHIVRQYGEIDFVSFSSDSTDFDVTETNEVDNWRKRVDLSYSDTPSPRVSLEEILNDTDSGGVVRKISYEYDWEDRINNENYGNICNYDSSYALDRLNLPVQTQVGNGPETDYWYDKVGNVIETSYGGVTTRYEFDASTEYSKPGKKIEIISETDSLITEYSYYPNTGLLQEVTDPNGNTTTYKYEEPGRIIKVIKPGDNINSPTIEYGYEDSNKKKWSKVKGEEKMYTFYDGLGRKIQTQRKDSQNGMTVVQSFGYDERSRLTTILLPVYSSVSLGSFDEANSFEGEVMPSPDMYKSIHYDALGRNTLIRIPTDDGNAYTKYQYNGRDVITITPESDTIKKVYDAFGENTAIIEYGNVDSLVTEFEYDDIGQLKKTTDPEGKEIQYAYNNWGKVISKKVPDKGNIEMEYDTTTGQLIFSVDPTERENAQFKAYQYDDFGRLILSGLSDSISTPWYEFEGCNNTSMWTDRPEGCLSAGEHINGPHGSNFMVQLIDTGNVSTIYRDFYPRHLAEIRFWYTFGRDGTAPDSVAGQFELIITNAFSDSLCYYFADTFTHIGNGNHRWFQIILNFEDSLNSDFDFSCINELKFRYIFGEYWHNYYGYDTANFFIDYIRFWEQRKEQNGEFIKADSLYYDSYEQFNLSVPDSINNPKGRLVRINDETGWQMFFYDNRGRTASKWQYIRWLDDTLKVYYQYNSADKLVSMIYPDGSKINYNYTNSGLLQEIETGSGQSLVTRYHDVHGLDSCLIYGNGVERIFQRTPRALIKEDEIYDGSASLVFDRSLGYRSDGRLSSVYSDDTLSASYQYDHYGRLTGENYQDGSFNYSYLYDKIGNRLKSNDDTLTYYSLVVGDDTLKTNRLKTAYADSFAYNGDGSATFFGGDVYEYNWKNRVEHIDVNDSYIDHDFFYDYDFQGLRVRKEEKTVDEVFGLRGKPIINIRYNYTYYFYDAGGRLLCEYDEGNLKRKYVYLPSAVIQISSNDTSYLHLDNLGSPAVVTNEDGNVVKSYRYYAFGNLRAQSGSFNTDYSFTGYLKEETGNHYAKMRYYEGGIGRFLRPDPLGALNPYVYCGNDPLNFVDPSGLNAQNAWPLYGPGTFWTGPIGAVARSRGAGYGDCITDASGDLYNDYYVDLCMMGMRQGWEDGIAEEIAYALRLLSNPLYDNLGSIISALRPTIYFDYGVSEHMTSIAYFSVQDLSMHFNRDYDWDWASLGTVLTHEGTHLVQFMAGDLDPDLSRYFVYHEYEAYQNQNEFYLTYGNHIKDLYLLDAFNGALNAGVNGRLYIWITNNYSTR